MSYLIKHPDYAQAAADVRSYDYALLYQFSEIRLCRTGDVQEKDWDECMEARVFSETSELHLFPQEKTAILVLEDENAEEQDYIQTEYYLGKAFCLESFTKIKIKQYMKADTDGQMTITLTRLAGLA